MCANINSWRAIAKLRLSSFGLILFFLFHLVYALGIAEKNVPKAAVNFQVYVDLCQYFVFVSAFQINADQYQHLTTDE